MKLFRVTNERFAASFDGKGASFEDGARWNSAGNPALYFGLDMATALVEAANYHPSPRLMPASHCKAIYEVDDRVPTEKLEASLLPADWDEIPYPKSTQRIGDLFLQANKALLLLVPSVGVGVRDIYSMALFNPRHPDATQIKLIECIRPVYSPRMFTHSQFE